MSLNSRPSPSSALDRCCHPSTLLQIFSQKVTSVTVSVSQCQCHSVTASQCHRHTWIKCPNVHIILLSPFSDYLGPFLRIKVLFLMEFQVLGISLGFFKCEIGLLVFNISKFLTVSQKLKYFVGFFFLFPPSALTVPKEVYKLSIRQSLAAMKVQCSIDRRSVAAKALDEI